MNHRIILGIFLIILTFLTQCLKFGLKKCLINKIN